MQAMTIRRKLSKKSSVELERDLHSMILSMISSAAGLTVSKTFCAYFKAKLDCYSMNLVTI